MEVKSFFFVVLVAYFYLSVENSFCFFRCSDAITTDSGRQKRKLAMKKYYDGIMAVAVVYDQNDFDFSSD